MAIHSMHYGKGYLTKASATALTLGMWAAACSSTKAPASAGSVAAAGPAAGNVGTGGAAASGTVAGGTPSTATTGATTADPTTTAAVTGASAANSATGGAGSMGVTGGMNATGTIGGTGTTGSVATAGTSTTGAPEPACATRPALAAPGLVDFESYDGASAALDWSFEFNDDGSGMNLLYGGFFDNGDGSGAATLNMVGGDTSTWAVKATNSEASVWGGGIGFWLGCLNASSYQGISLAVRGATPNQNGVSVAITVDGLTEGVGTTIFVTDLFTTFELPFTEFTNESGETTNGDNIVGLVVNAQMMWLQDEVTEDWNPIPGAYEIVVDDITFY